MIGFTGEKEMLDDEDIKISLYSLYKCWPEEDNSTETIFSGDGKKIPDDIQTLLKKRIRRHVVKYFSKSTFENAIKDTSKSILVRAYSCNNIDDWTQISLELADRYAKEDRAKNALIMISNFQVKKNKFVCLLRYNLTEQIQLDDSKNALMKLKIVDKILEEESSKSALYPSTTSFEKSHIDSKMIKIHDPNNTEHFRNTIGVDELPPRKQIDKKLKELIEKAKESKKPISIENLIEILRSLIREMNEKYRRSIKSKITIKIGNVKIEADISNIFDGIDIERIGDTMQKVSIKGSNAKIKYDTEEYDIVL